MQLSPCLSHHVHIMFHTSVFSSSQLSVKLDHVFKKDGELGI